MEIIFIVLALAVGFAVGYLLEKVSANSLRTRIGVLESQLGESRRAAEESVKRLEESHRRVFEERESAYAQLTLSKDAAHAEALRRQEASHAEELRRQEAAHKDALEALQGRFDETVAKMRAELENATSEMLKRRQMEFESSSREGISRVLEPLNVSIREMRQAVADNTEKHADFGGRLSANIKMVLEHSDAARKSADRLADALRGGGKIQGDWGETVLTELLESQGLTEGVHFETQAMMRDASGNLLMSDSESRLKPDVILHLDRDRDVIIDAKVSLSAYLDYMQAETEEKREQAIREHVRSVENHVNELVRKNYSSYVHAGRQGIDYVIMFVPNTTALYAAVSRKPDLWRKAMERGVYIADEQTLYAALKIISMTWRQISQAENHEKVYGLANEMLDRVGMFMEKFSAIGRKIEETSKSYDDAMSKLRDSGQSIPVTCRKLVKLGAKPQKQRNVDPSLLGMSE